MPRHLLAVLLIAAATRTASADDVAGPDVLALGGSQVLAGADVVHADGSDGAALRLGGRLALGGGAGFVEGELPLGWQRQAGAVALGNLTLRAGLFAHGGRFAAAALRISAPTAPRVGSGADTAAALAAPRVADPELFLPHTGSVEALADWRWGGAVWWLQLEPGAALWWQPDRPTDAVLRGTVAGGIRVDTWLDLAASFVTRSFVLAHDPAENFVHALVLALVVHGGGRQVALRLEVPIDNAARDDNRFLAGLELRGW